jgi:RimJ/RimL family protein N-acetyltransferase
MKIIYSEKTKNGEKCVIRYPEVEDLETMTNYINTLSKEQTYIRYQGEQQTLEEEEKFLEESLNKIDSQKMVYLGIFIGDKMIGSSSIGMMDKVESHIGVFGISILKEFRGEGMGKILMRLVLKEAQKYLPGLRIVILKVYSENKTAYNLYKELGFVQYGLLSKGVIYKGRYLDCILMYKNID